MLKKTLKRKSRGNMGDILGTLVCLIFMFIILTSMVNCFRLLDKKSDLKRITRKYALILEYQGKLTDTQINDLSDELVNCGFPAPNSSTCIVSLPENQVAYGNDVEITITATLSASELHLFKSMPDWNGNYTFSSRNKTISKAAVSR